MTVTEFANWLGRFGDQIRDTTPDIIAETATEYFKETFSKKEFDSKSWAAAKPKTTGSLLIDSGSLLNSIEPVVVSKTEVLISAGNDKVQYAQAHNEGFKGVVSIPTHTRKGKTVEAHSRKVDLPKRQFMGNANQLNAKIKQRIEGHISSLTSNSKI